MLLLDIQAGQVLFRHRLAANVCLPSGWQTGIVVLQSCKAGAYTITWLGSTASTGAVLYHNFRANGQSIPVRNSDGRVLPGFLIKADMDGADKARVLSAKNHFIAALRDRCKAAGPTPVHPTKREPVASRTLAPCKRKGHVITIQEKDVVTVTDKTGTTKQVPVTRSRSYAVPSEAPRVSKTGHSYVPGRRRVL